MPRFLEGQQWLSAMTLEGIKDIVFFNGMSIIQQSNGLKKNMRNFKSEKNGFFYRKIFFKIWKKPSWCEWRSKLLLGHPLSLKLWTTCSKGPPNLSQTSPWPGKKKHQLSPMFGIPKLGIWLAFQLLVLHCFWIPFFFDIGFVWTLVYQQMWWINGISHSIPIRIFMAIQQKHMYPLVNYRNYGKSPFLMANPL